MKVFAISDLHLSTNCAKPMDIFGKSWENYWELIQADWQSKVSDNDVVLIAGDISWAMELANARPDLNAIAQLKGKKVIIKGNHDYWWSS
ncbi:MAG: metallophosphoesterase, partial [Clostridia bacterium]